MERKQKKNDFLNRFLKLLLPIMTREVKDFEQSKGGISRIFDFITEAIGWLQIVASPLLIGVVIGMIIYFTEPQITRLIIGIIIATVGLVFGIILATKQWKGEGTIWLMSRIKAIPEMENHKEVVKLNPENNNK